MRIGRRQMTVRLVPLQSLEAGEARVGGSAGERVALVARLSEMLWLRTGYPFPEYTRATMPIVVTSLRDQSDRA